MRTFSLAKAIVSANSPKDYAEMADGSCYKKTYSYLHKPYHIGNRNLLVEYTALLKEKGVIT